MQYTQIIPSSEDKINRKQLQASIRKKRLKLKNLVIKTEMLKIELEMIRQEYMVRIGSLFVKDNTIDLEIMHLKNIISLMNQGKSYEQAEKELSESFYAKQLKEELEKEEEHVNVKHEDIQVGVNNYLPLQNDGDIKKLWKKLIGKFHPDLVQNRKKKRLHEKIMKQINQAYEEGNITQLKKIEQEHTIDHDNTVAMLEDMLIEIENEIIHVKKLHQTLLDSEWYSWKIKIREAKKRNYDIFATEEKKLLNDIMSKYTVINSLREQIEQLELSHKGK